MKYQDLHAILKPPRKYPFDDVIDSLIKQYKDISSFEAGALPTIGALTAKEQRKALDRLVADLSPAVDQLLRFDNLLLTSLLYETGQIKKPGDAAAACFRAGAFLQRIVDAALLFEPRGRGRKRQNAARWLVWHLGVLYEHFGGRATSNNDFIEFCELCFRYAGRDLFNPYSESDGRATLKGLINSMNRINKKTGTTPLQWSKKSKHFRENLRLKK